MCNCEIDRQGEAGVEKEMACMQQRFYFLRVAQRNLDLRISSVSAFRSNVGGDRGAEKYSLLLLLLPLLLSLLSHPLSATCCVAESDRAPSGSGAGAWVRQVPRWFPVVRHPPPTCSQQRHQERRRGPVPHMHPLHREGPQHTA